jgi:uncharacterized protein YcbK (DUF882 family)
VNPPPTRASFLGALGAAALAGVPALARAQSAATTAPIIRERVLWLRRLDYDEEATAPFTLDGRTVFAEGKNALDWILRDYHVPVSEGLVDFDIVTMEVAWEVQQILRNAGINRPLIVHSGYRTPETNAKTENAARFSQHMRARAIDFHVDGVSIADLWRLCYTRALAGGLGYYPSGWVHLDSADRRYWVGDNGLYVPQVAIHPALLA